jgi:hypothetical protein
MFQIYPTQVTRLLVMENAQSKVDQLTRDAFSILLILFLLGCIVTFFISVINSRFGPGSISTAGIIAVFWVQIKWDIIKRARIKDSSVPELTELIKAETDSNE